MGQREDTETESLLEKLRSVEIQDIKDLESEILEDLLYFIDKKTQYQKLVDREMQRLKKVKSLRKELEEEIRQCEESKRSE